MARNPRGWFFSILTVSSKNLFNNSTHKRCFLLQNSPILSPQNTDVMNPFEFLGNNITNSVSTLAQVSGSILTIPGE